MHLTDDYLSLLRMAMRCDAVRVFVRTRLAKSLSAIGIDNGCIAAIHRLLDVIAYRRTLTPEGVVIEAEKFQKTWRVHLNRSYFVDYEQLRWGYLRDFVLKDIDPNVQLGRCLDVGCGRGWLTAQLRASGLADYTLGIDAAKYEPEWKERLTQFRSVGLDFAHVQTGELSDWLQCQARFDTVLMLYVLHHSTEYWAIRTLSTLRGIMAPDCRLVILEDSYSAELAAKHDHDGIAGLWASLGAASHVYALTDGFHIQTVLDFVAVQLLACFGDVEMPCTYRRMTEWESLFVQLGFRIERSVYLGFPQARDIDVPQAYFVLRST